MFKKGQSGNPAGGKIGNHGGRPVDEFKRKCQKIAKSPKFFTWIRKILDGEIVVDPETKMKAWKLISDRGFGMPAQEMTLLGDGSAMVLVRPESKSLETRKG